MNDQGLVLFVGASNLVMASSLCPLIMPSLELM